MSSIGGYWKFLMAFKEQWNLTWPTVGENSQEKGIERRQKPQVKPREQSQKMDLQKLILAYAGWLHRTVSIELAESQMNYKKKKKVKLFSCSELASGLSYLLQMTKEVSGFGIQFTIWMKLNLISRTERKKWYLKVSN